MSIDLSAQQNHWHVHTDCDGNDTVVGCPDARDVLVTATVTTPGDGLWGQQSLYATLPSVHDADTTEENCNNEGGNTDPCNGFGACVSGCQNDCGNASDCPTGPTGNQCRATINACRSNCNCECSEDFPEGCGSGACD